MFSHFRGRLIQVAESLDYGDAVSNNMRYLSEIFTKCYGIKSEIFVKYCDDRVKHCRRDLNELIATEKDIIFFHFSGASAFAAEKVLNSRCTRVLIYHNITPAHYFPEKTHAYRLCDDGRKQLTRIVNYFHRFIADSSFNLEELISLGAPRENSFVIPIIVPTPTDTTEHKVKTGTNNWVFVGRISPNKRQDKLVEIFGKFKQTYPMDNHLYLVGKFEEDDQYYRSICNLIDKLQLKDNVTLTGQIDDDKLGLIYGKADIFVSLSEHEGFGVPLIEAFHHDVPVIALARTAVVETMEYSPGLIDDTTLIVDAIHRTFTDGDFRERILRHQQNVRKKYLPQAVEPSHRQLLNGLLPSYHQFRHVSLVICTYNRAELLRRCLDYLQYQTNPNFEVIVVNGPSTDDTEHVLQAYHERVIIGRTQKRNLSASRNIGIEMSSGDIVAFIDDDAIPHDDWIDTLLKAYNEVPLNVAGVGGTTFLAGSFEYQNQDLAVSTTAEVQLNAQTDTFEDPAWCRYLHGTNSSFKRTVLLEVKGFDEEYDYYLDESDLCYRIQKNNKYFLLFQPDAYVRHEFAKSENRKGKYDYNWFSICKNTAYFVLKTNIAKTRKENEKLVEKKLNAERISQFKNAYKIGEVSKVELNFYRTAVREGLTQGLADAERPRKLRTLEPSASALMPFLVKGHRDSVGFEMKRLHIAFVTQEFPPFIPGGGVGTLYHNLAHELLQMGHFVTVVAPGKEKEEYRRGRFVLYRVPVKEYLDRLDSYPILQKNMNWACTAADAILSIHAYRSIDVIDSSLWDTESFALTTIRQQHGIPIILRLVTPLKVAARINAWHLGDQQLDLLIDAERDLIRNADCVIPISDSIAETVEQEYGVRRNSKWRQNYIGIRYWPTFDVNLGYEDMNRIDKRLQETKNNIFKVLFLGRLELRKGIDIFLEAAKRILKENEDSIFVVAGDDPQSWQTKTTANLPSRLAHRLVFLGEIDEPTKEKLLNWADLLIFPSRYESFGLVPLEAFVHGTPVIASRSGAIPEIVEDGVSGLLFDDGDSNSLYSAINKVMNDATILERLGEGARKQIHKFSARNMTLETIRIYKNTMAQMNV